MTCIPVLCHSQNSKPTRLLKYSQEIIAVDWKKAQKLAVSNPASADLTIPVVVKVNKRKGMCYAVINSNGYPVLSQSDDLDGDGAIDEVVFLTDIKGGEKAYFYLLSAEGKTIKTTPAFQISQKQIGSWRPLRFVPTTSPGPYHDASSISQHNQKMSKKLIQILSKKRPMTILEGDLFRLIIGNKSGLIEGMYPKALRGFAGSYFREFVPEGEIKGQLKLLADGPVRVVLEWNKTDSFRKISVYKNGQVHIEWQHIPKQMQLISSAHPYTFMATGNKDIVRFSQIIEKKRSLPLRTYQFYLFGFKNLSLECEYKGFCAVSEELWMDPGEILYELGRQQQALHNTTVADVRKYVYPVMKKLCQTYLGGGVRIVTLNAEAKTANLSYMIGQRGFKAIGSFHEKSPQVVLDESKLSQETNFPKIKLPAVKPSFEVQMPDKSLTVMRIYPNHFNGWKLRPLVQAKQNPLPAFYPIVIKIRGDKPKTIQFNLEISPWILEAQMLSKEYVFKGLTDYKKEEPIGGQKITAITVDPGEEVRCLLRVRAKEDTLGKYLLNLKWKSGRDIGNFVLSLNVKPECIFYTKQAGSNFSQKNIDMLKYFSNVKQLGGMYWLLGTGHSISADNVKLIRMQFRDYQRKGFLISEHFHVQQYIGQHFTKKQWGNGPKDKLYQLKPAEYIKKVKEIYQKYSDIEQYRCHLYTGDEIWEKIGGYNGRYLLSIEKTAKLLEKLVYMTKTPAYNSFTIHGVDAGYQVKLANDIPLMFFYCGYDEGIKEYARKLLIPRQALFKKWCHDPKLMKLANTNKPKALYGFWMSARLHQDNYNTVRRHLWWLRHNGFDNLIIWAMASWNIVYGNVGDWSAMATGYSDSFILTDRSLAIMDAKDDMALITLVRILKSKADKNMQEKVTLLETKAFQLSQKNLFNQARHNYIKAVKLMQADLIYLTPPDFCTPVKTNSLPDPTIESKKDIEAARKLPVVYIPKISGKNCPIPTIDGKVDRAYLEEGIATGDFRLLDGSPYVGESTILYLTRDNENLYMLFMCQESKMDSIKTKVSKHDASVYTDDSIEIFIQPNQNKNAYFHVVVSAAGVTYDSKHEGRKRDISWNPDWKITVARKKLFWSVEIAIPFSSIGGVPKPGQVWRMNFGRNEIPHRETSSWSAAFGSFHNTKRFGKIKF